MSLPEIKKCLITVAVFGLQVIEYFNCSVDNILIPICAWNRSRPATGLAQGSKNHSGHKRVPGL